MKVQSKIGPQIEDTELSLTITMKVGRWRRLHEEMKDARGEAGALQYHIKLALGDVFSATDRLIEGKDVEVT